MVDHAYDEATLRELLSVWTLSNKSYHKPRIIDTFIKPHAPAQELLDDLVRNRPGAEVFNNYLHLRIIWKASVLLLKSKVGRVEMQNERGRTFRIFLEDVGCGFDCSGQTGSVIAERR